MAFGSGLDDTDEVMSEINMIPLVDIMLVLLIIFIVTVPVVTHSVQLDLPRAESAPNELEPDVVTISVAENGAVAWNDAILSEQELADRLAAAAQARPQPQIQIHGHRNATYESVIKVMAAAQRAGLDQLGFVTRPES